MPIPMPVPVPSPPAMNSAGGWPQSKTEQTALLLCADPSAEVQNAAKNGGGKGAGSIMTINARPRGKGRRRDDGTAQVLPTIASARHDILAIQLNWRPMSPARSAKPFVPLPKSSNQKKTPRHDCSSSRMLTFGVGTVVGLAGGGGGAGSCLDLLSSPLVWFAFWGLCLRSEILGVGRLNHRMNREQKNDGGIKKPMPPRPPIRHNTCSNLPVATVSAAPSPDQTVP